MSMNFNNTSDYFKFRTELMPRLKQYTGNSIKIKWNGIGTTLLDKLIDCGVNPLTYDRSTHTLHCIGMTNGTMHDIIGENMNMADAINMWLNVFGEQYAQEYKNSFRKVSHEEAAAEEKKANARGLADQHKADAEKRKAKVNPACDAACDASTATNKVNPMHKINDKSIKDNINNIKPNIGLNPAKETEDDNKGLVTFHIISFMRNNEERVGLAMRIAYSNHYKLISTNEYIADKDVIKVSTISESQYPLIMLMLDSFHAAGRKQTEKAKQQRHTDDHEVTADDLFRKVFDSDRNSPHYGIMSFIFGNTSD